MSFNTIEMEKFAVHLETRGVKADWQWYYKSVGTPPYDPSFPAMLHKLELKFPADYPASELIKEVLYVLLNHQDFLVSKETNVQTVDHKTVVTFFFTYDELVKKEDPQKRSCPLFRPEPGEENW